MRKNPPKRSDFKAFRSLQTRWMDNDIYGHMNNVVHYSLFDTAVNGWLIEAGLLELSGGQTSFLVVETGCKYFGEIAFPDQVTAGVRVSRLGGSSVRYEVGLFRNENDTASAAGFFVHVHVSRADHRPALLSPAQRQGFAPITMPTP